MPNKRTILFGIAAFTAASFLYAPWESHTPSGRNRAAGYDFIFAFDRDQKLRTNILLSQFAAITIIGVALYIASDNT